MADLIQPEAFRNTLFALLDETFENQHRIHLDRDTGLFRTLESVSAQEASGEIRQALCTLKA
jgi:hypothetical protein